MILTEQQQQWLEDMVFKGEASREVSILNDNAKVTIVSLSGEKQLEVEKSIGGTDGTALFIMHSYSINALSYALKKFTAKEMVAEFKDQPAALNFIKTRPAVVIDAMVKAQATFEAELKKITSPEIIEANFSTTPGTEKESTSI